MFQDMGDGGKLSSSIHTATGNSQAVHELLNVDEVEIPLNGAESPKECPRSAKRSGERRHSRPSSTQPDSTATRAEFSPTSETSAGRGMTDSAAGRSRASNSPYAPPEIPSQTDVGTVEKPRTSSSAVRPRPLSSAASGPNEAYLAFAREQGERERQQQQQQQEAAAAASATPAAAGHPSQTGTFSGAVSYNAQTGVYVNSTRYTTASGAEQPSPSTANRSGGNGYYFCDGTQAAHKKKALGKFRKLACLTVSPQWHHMLFLVFIILLFGLMFLTSVVPRGEIYSYVIGSVFMFLSLSCLFLSVCIDPGIIPPAPRSEAPLESEFVEINGVQVECKPCRTCNIIRPPRSNHCKFSDVCVEEYDHFCPVVGSLVARRTYRFFGGFFIVTMVLCFYIFIRSIIVLYAVRNTFQNSTFERWQFAAGVLCTIAAFFGGCFVIPFSFMYVNMACLNTTQKELMRRSAEQRTAWTTGGVNEFGLGTDPHTAYAARAEAYQQAKRNEPEPEFCGGQFAPNTPYATNPCWDCLTRFFGPLGWSKVPVDYYV